METLSKCVSAPEVTEEVPSCLLILYFENSRSPTCGSPVHTERLKRTGKVSGAGPELKVREGVDALHLLLWGRDPLQKQESRTSDLLSALNRQLPGPLAPRRFLSQRPQALDSGGPEEHVQHSMMGNGFWERGLAEASLGSTTRRVCGHKANTERTGHDQEESTEISRE